MKTLKKALMLAILFICGGLLYAVIELLFRGFTHYSMIIVGGICFLLIDGINEVLPEDTAITSQMIFSAIIITLIEFIAGVILNLWLKLNIWDYSHLPYNLLGQICLIFTVAWFFLSAAGILLGDLLRHYLFKKPRKRYKIL